eukprot:Anaeramoba_flamelloidesa1058236_73.p1 GENE.a1058236_73~~a1058236_73.p1  ORF type:complete len:146 (-),score=12.80 a1058236_73:210-605(-)
MSKQPTNGKNQSVWLSYNLPPQEIKKYTRKEVRKHKGDNWVIFKNKVYDLTHYLQYHPGGQDTIIPYLGKDITRVIKSVHGWVNMEALLRKCHIGDITLNTNYLDHNNEKSGKTKSRPVTPSRLRFSEVKK